MYKIIFMICIIKLKETMQKLVFLYTYTVTFKYIVIFSILIITHHFLNFIVGKDHKIKVKKKRTECEYFFHNINVIHKYCSFFVLKKFYSSML